MTRRHHSAVAEAPEQPVAVGATFAGLRIERTLSRRPGRDELFEATSPKGKRVALRLFDGPFGQDEELRRRVLRLASLKESIEPPLLPVLGAVEIGGGRLALAHDLPRGETLADLMRAAPLEREEAVAILSRVAGALETVGALGLPAGELTPDDIFVTSGRPRQALLADFGIGLVSGRGCESPIAIEGADYCAPEAVRGAPVEPASNVYALACILVECLTGAPPYPYDRPLLTLHAHLVEQPPKVSERVDGLPPALDDVVASGMSKHPQQRPASPAAFMRAAQQALGVKAPIPIIPAAKRPKRARRPAAEQQHKRPAEQPQKRTREQQHGGARERARATPPRPARRRRPGLRGPVAVGLGLAVLASTAGFAAGSNLGATTQPPTPAGVTHTDAEYVRAVEGVAQRLSARRAAARSELQRARRASEQAAAAATLAAAYSEAYDALASTPAPAPAETQLVARLRGAKDAYRRLSGAARRHDARAFRAAGKAVLRHERELDRALARL
jgi:hypothetical protein